MEPIQQLNNELDDVVAEVESLATKSDEASVKALAAARTKMAGIKTRIEALQETAGIKSWQNTVPAEARNTTNAVITGGGKQTKAADGQTVIDLATGNVVEESGAGVLTGTKMTAIANPDYLKSYPDFLRSRGLENVKSVDARKSLAEGIDSDGGLLVPAEMLAGIIKREPAVTRIVEKVRTVNVSSDKATMLRSVYNADDFYSSSVRVYKTAEGAAATATGQPVFGTLNIDVHQFTAEISISRALLEDTAFDVMGFMAEEFRTAYRNHCADKVINGSGVGEHYGILTRTLAAKGTDVSPAIVKSGQAAALTFDGLQALKFSVPEQYDQNCSWLFNKRSTGLAIASLKDNDGRPLWPVQQQAGMVNGEPASLLGYNYAYESFMPDVAANALPILFGDFGAYVRAMRLGMTLEPLREIEARRGQVVFLARFREGGDVIESYRLKAQKVAA